jgi:SagB-type dehydrogenase family enzyme
MNRDIEASWIYHGKTNHSYKSIRSGPHQLDWSNQPIPFKIYSSIEPLTLPTDFSPSQTPALSSIEALPVSSNISVLPDLKTIAHLLHFSAGITKKITYPAGTMYFRAAACTGALYHIDLYLICGNLPGVDAGVYHFSPHDFSLRRLRTGDFRGVLANATGHEKAVVQAPAHIICTSTYWRNSWKYQSRTYRHCFWDSGTILANLLAVAASLNLRAHIVLGFVDLWVANLLGLDTDREVALGIIPLGWNQEESPNKIPNMEPLAFETTPLSKGPDVDFPAIRTMHASSSLASIEETILWRSPPPLVPLEEALGPVYPLLPTDRSVIPQKAIETVILRRGSSRKFTYEGIDLTQLSDLLLHGTSQVPLDLLPPGSPPLNDLYIIANHVEGIPKGAYFYRRAESTLELLKEGDFRDQARYLDLEQKLAGDASLNIYLFSNLHHVLSQWGNRGYRAAQLEAAIIGGRLYLTAYTLGLGASGLTFYDNDVTTFFSPHASTKSPMFLVAVGKPAKKRNDV